LGKIAAFLAFYYCASGILEEIMRYLKSNKLYCFSPPVMLATFIVEIACAFYVLARYKLTEVSRLAVAILLGLALFQLAEYNVCEGSWGVDSLTWARIGYVAITLLPPLGLHLTLRISGQKRQRLLWGTYGVAALFSIIFLFVGHGMQSQECLGNYIIFTIAPWAVWPYVVYYYGLLVITVACAWHAAATNESKSMKKSLYSLALGYMMFIIPTTTANILDPTTISGIPSIMCGFAVILALILTGFTLPAAGPKVKKASLQ
jgi:hypothetical protein